MTERMPSWRLTPTRQTILDFVDAVSDPDDPRFVPVDDRVAVFDNDGTLWSEKPMIVQLHFLLGRWKEQVERDPSLADRQPYRAAASGDLSWLAGAVDKHYAGDDADMTTLIGAVAAATNGETVEDYGAAVTTFLTEARHLTSGAPYRDTVYQPMVELLRELDAHDFRTFIVSGGERDFLRAMAWEYYGVPSERVVGTAMGLVYDPEANIVRYAPSLDFFDDGPIKPVRIWTRIGRRPILAGGNSNGDVPMLRYAQGSPASLALLVHHDDDTDRGDPPYDTGAEAALQAAREHGFTVVSVRDDWEHPFPVAGDGASASG